MYDLVINNGKIVFPHEVSKGSIGIKDGIISKISKNSIDKAEKIIDASNKVVFPGIIDPHVHLDLATPKGNSVDDFRNGSIVAAFGGITTMKTFIHPTKTVDLRNETERRLTKAKKDSLIDYSFHVNVLDSKEDTLEFIKELQEKRITNSLKAYLTYDMKIDDSTLLQLFKTGMIIATHAEDDTIVTKHTKKLLEEGKSQIKYHAQARPAIAEIEAVSRLINLAKQSQGKLYLVHQTTASSIELIRKAREEYPYIYGETAPHYLLFTEDALDGEEGSLFTMTPPLRTKNDQNGLWEGIKNNNISTIGTDHCPFTKKQKKYGMENVTFNTIANGVMGMETMFPSIYTNSIQRGISLVQLANIFSLNVAKIFELYPKKGAIEINADADLFIFNPNEERTVNKENMHTKADYSIYEEKKFLGWPETTVSRGNILIEDNLLINKDFGRGLLVKTRIKQS